MLHQLRRRPAFAGTLIAVLAAGVAVATAMFSVVHGVLLRSLPYPDADRLVILTSIDPRVPEGRSVAGAADFHDWRARQQVFEAMALIRPVASFNLTGSGEPERLAGARVTAGLCETLRIVPLLGRCFSDAEEREPARASSVVLLSHGLWQRRFGGDPSIVGRAVRLNGSAHEVVGVLGPDVRFPSRDVELWAPLYIPPANLTLRRDYSYLAVARLKPGVALGAASAHMAAVAAALAREYPATNAADAVNVAPLQSSLTASVRRPLLVLLGAVGLLFGITVFSIATLVLVQLAGRAPEMALRATLGASRARLVRQLLGEMVPLALAGVLLGLAGAEALRRAIVAMLPAALPRVDEIALHWPVALFGMTLAAVAMAMPASIAMWNVRTSLRRGPATWVRLRDTLVTAQVAATVTLLVASTLFATSLARLRAVDPGLDATRVLTLQLAVDRTRHGDDAGVAAYLERLVDAVRAVPGVEAAGLINRLPLGGQVQAGDVRLEGHDAPVATNWRSIDAGYTGTVRVPLIAGRSFDAGDSAAAPPVGLVDERFAAPFGGARAVLGKRVRIDAPGAGLPWIEIVGVVGHVHDEGLDRRSRPIVYWPLAQRTQDRMAMVVRAATDPVAIAADVRRAIRGVDPDQTIADLRPMTAVVERSLETARLAATFTTTFAVLALGLAATGLFGVLSSLTLRRRREFGVRLALGASRGQLARIVLQQAGSRAGLGVAVGLGLAALLAGSVRALLFAVEPIDPAAYAIVAAVVFVVAALAASVPAWRASRTDPLASLRAEP